MHHGSGEEICVFFRCHVSIFLVDRYVYVCTKKYTRIYIYIYYRYDIQNYIYKQKNIYTLAEYSYISILIVFSAAKRGS